MEVGLIIRIVISVIVVIVLGYYQYDEACYEYSQNENSLTWIIIKRSLFFLIFSLALVLIIFTAGGGNNEDEPLRRWEEGRG